MLNWTLTRQAFLTEHLTNRPFIQLPETAQQLIDAANARTKRMQRRYRGLIGIMGLMLFGTILVMTAVVGPEVLKLRQELARVRGQLEMTSLQRDERPSDADIELVRFNTRAECNARAGDHYYEAEQLRNNNETLARIVFNLLNERYPATMRGIPLNGYVRASLFNLNTGENVSPSEYRSFVTRPRYEMDGDGCPTRASIEFNRLLGIGTEGWTSRGLCPNSVPRPRAATPIAVSRACSVGTQEIRARGAELSALAARVRTIARDVERNNAAVNSLRLPRPR